MLGDFYFALGDLDKATAEYQAVFLAHPKDGQAKKNYIQLLILKDRLDEASRLNDEVLKANAKDAEGLIYRGQIQLKRGQPRDASSTLQSVLAADPDNAIAHYHLGAANDALGNMQSAESEWRIAVRPTCESPSSPATSRADRKQSGRT